MTVSPWLGITDEQIAEAEGSLAWAGALQKLDTMMALWRKSNPILLAERAAEREMEEAEAAEKQAARESVEAEAAEEAALQERFEAEDGAPQTGGTRGFLTPVAASPDHPSGIVIPSFLRDLVYSIYILCSVWIGTPSHSEPAAPGGGGRRGGPGSGAGGGGGPGEGRDRGEGGGPGGARG
jgi:hypothetical protein